MTECLLAVRMTLSLKKWTPEILFFSLSFTHTCTHSQAHMHILVLVSMWGLSKTQRIPQPLTLNIPTTSSKNPKKKSLNPILSSTLKVHLNPQTVLWSWRDPSRCPHCTSRMGILVLNKEQSTQILRDPIFLVQEPGDSTVAWANLKGEKKKPQHLLTHLEKCFLLAETMIYLCTFAAFNVHHLSSAWIGISGSSWGRRSTEKQQPKIWSDC